jgi:geranylgeranyl diphosphate synthase type II
MDFKEFSGKYHDAIYKKICEYVPMKEPEEHYRIMRDYIDRQGKYARPTLLLLTAHLYGATIEDAILPAAAQQLSEDWILMQDDWEDDSELRRGKPTAHRIYGAIHAVNASNTGQIAMWRMLKDYIIKVGTEKGGKLYDKFYDMMRYTVEGQYVENKFIHNTKDLSKASEELYFRIVDSKTCFYTIYGPLQLGAMVGNATDEDVEHLKEIGEPTGKAFQIVDDILDMTANEKEFGKKLFGDLYEGKLTLMVLHAYKNATPQEKSRMNAIYAKIRQQKTEDDIKFIRDMVEKYKGIEYARGVADKYGEQAKKVLNKYVPTMPNNEYRKIMSSAVEDMFVRKK